MSPDLPVEYSNKVDMLFHLDRFEETEKALVDAAAHHAMSADVLATRYRLALLKQAAGADAAGAMSHSQIENELVMWHVQALSAAHDGRLDDADRDSRRAMEMARDAGLLERAAVIRASQGVWNSFLREPRCRQAGGRGRFESVRRQGSRICRRIRAGAGW